MEDNIQTRLLEYILHSTMKRNMIGPKQMLMYGKVTNRNLIDT